MLHDIHENVPPSSYRQDVADLQQGGGCCLLNLLATTKTFDKHPHAAHRGFRFVDRLSDQKVAGHELECAEFVLVPGAALTTGIGGSTHQGFIGFTLGRQVDAHEAWAEYRKDQCGADGRRRCR